MYDEVDRIPVTLKNFIEVDLFSLPCYGGATVNMQTRKEGFNTTSFMRYRAFTMEIKHHIGIC